jgi:hypothetical protein
VQIFRAKFIGDLGGETHSAASTMAGRPYLDALFSFSLLHFPFGPLAFEHNLLFMVYLLAIILVCA